MKIIPVFLLLLLSGCANKPPQPLEQLHQSLMSIYTPVLQDSSNDPFKNHSGEEPFFGDCDDYFSAAWNTLNRAGYAPYVLTLYRKNESHIVACIDGETSYCLDPNSKSLLTSAKLIKSFESYKIYDSFRF